MKTKVKESNKAINVEIVIENNLMSKNKMIPPQEEKESQGKPLAKKPASSGALNGNMSRLLSEYYGVMAQRDLYRQSQPSPFNLQQFINPQRPEMTGNTTGVSGGIITTSIPNTQENNDVDEEGDEEYLNNNAVAEPPADEEGAAPSTQPPAPPITKQVLWQSVLDDPDDEKHFIADKTDEWKQRRAELIARITSSARIRLRPPDIVKFKLGRYVQEYRFTTWKRLLKEAKDSP